MRRRIPLALVCLVCALILCAPVEASASSELRSTPVAVAAPEPGTKEASHPGPGVVDEEAGLWGDVVESLRLLVYLIAS